MKTSLQQQVEQLIRSQVRELSAYHVPSADGMLKLDAMENPYSLPEELKQTWLVSIQDAALNRYPDPQAKQLCDAIRQHEKIDNKFSILLGNGSDEIIQMIIMALAKPNAKVLAPEPSFVMYKMIAKLCNVEFVGIDLNEDFSLNMPAMLQAIEEHQPAVVFLAYPNNPTGNLFSREQVEQIIQASHGLVVIDEAYTAFASDSLIDWLDVYDHMLLMRTYSKTGLAGLRLGYLIGQAAWLNEFDKVRLPYNINVLTQATVCFALQHANVLQQQTQNLKQSREQLAAVLANTAGVTVFPSEANFISFRVDAGAADEIFEALKAQKVLIKNLSAGHKLLRDCLRVTVGTDEENELFIQALKQTLAKAA
ncbi:MAG: histidinol-phosphate transaminase [Gammaproteobacteria bacterium]|nr:histidinol-phosphate transaminase [Gammaproteobacteria bacterium]